MSDIGGKYSEYATRWIEQMKVDAAHAYVEKPAMASKLPSLSGKTVIALGCGSGEECAELLERNPARLVGVDVAGALIEYAAETYPAAEFYVQDMESLDFADQTFDFVYSSLALHYRPDWRPTLREAHRVLKPGGHMLFSVPHPVLWSGEVVRTDHGKSKLLGYEVDVSGGDARVDIKGDYLNTIERHEVWFGDFPVTYFIKPFGEALRELRETGFELRELIEPKAVDAALGADPSGYVRSYGSAAQFHAIHQRLPLFAIFDVARI